MNQPLILVTGPHFGGAMQSVVEMVRAAEHRPALILVLADDRFEPLPPVKFEDLFPRYRPTELPVDVDLDRRVAAVDMDLELEWLTRRRLMLELDDELGYLRTLPFDPSPLSSSSSRSSS